MASYKNLKIYVVLGLKDCYIIKIKNVTYVCKIKQQIWNDLKLADSWTVSLIGLFGLFIF